MMMDLTPEDEPLAPWAGYMDGVHNTQQYNYDHSTQYATLHSLPSYIPPHIEHTPSSIANEAYSDGSGGSDVAMQHVVSSLQLHSSSSTGTVTPMEGRQNSCSSSGSGIYSNNSSPPGTFDPSDTEPEEQMQYVELNGQYMPLYAPSVSVPVLSALTLPATTNHHLTTIADAATTVTTAPQPANFNSNTDPNFNTTATPGPPVLSRAISGYEVVISEGVTSFRRAIDISTMPSAPSFDVPPSVTTNNNTYSTRYDARGVDNSIVLSHQARHSSHFSLYGMHRPLRSFHHSSTATSSSVEHSKYMIAHFVHDTTEKFLRVKLILAVICSCYQPPTFGIIAAALERPLAEVTATLHDDLAHMVSIGAEDKKSIVSVRPELKMLFRWLSDESYVRFGCNFSFEFIFVHFLGCCQSLHSIEVHKYCEYIISCTKILCIN